MEKSNKKRKMILTKREVQGFFKNGFFDGFRSLLETLMVGQRYDSISAYNLMFKNSTDEQISRNALTILDLWDSRGQIKQKQGQDCYDTLFELILVIPEVYKPRIVGCRNNIHLDDDQLLKTPFLHVAIVVTNLEDNKEYLLEPTKWIFEPFLIEEGSQKKGADGNINTFQRVDGSGFVLDEYKVRKNRHDIVPYSAVPNGFDMSLNYRNFLRIKDRYNCITSRVMVGQPVYYVKFNPLKNYFDAFLPEGNAVLTLEDIKNKSEQLGDIFEDQKLSEKLIEFIRLMNIIPNNFWI